MKPGHAREGLKSPGEGLRGNKKALPANRFDIPLSFVYWGRYNLLLRLCSADPVKHRVYFPSRVCPKLRGFDYSVLMVACETTGRLAAQLAAFLPAPASIKSGV